jgi:hypothetical protein
MTATVTLDTDARLARWRPFAQWLLAVPHLLVVHVLGTLRSILTLIGFVAVLVTGRMSRSIFDAVAMTYRYEWRALSYALFLHDDYPPFDLTPSAEDDGRLAAGTLSIAYPEHLSRWKPLYTWLLAVPHYVVGAALAVVSVLTVAWNAAVVLTTGHHSARARRFLVGAYRYSVRVQAYVGLLTDEYPPFRLAD